jgi:hypothetical protein
MTFRYAIEHVRSDFLSILADDDVLLPDFHLLAMESFAAPALVTVGSTLFTDSEDRLLRPGQIGQGSYQPPYGLVEIMRLVIVIVAITGKAKRRTERATAPKNMEEQQ